MIKFFKIFSIVLMILILIFISIGILASSHTYFTRTFILKSPVAVVWGHLLNVENYPAWQEGTKKVEITSGHDLEIGTIIRIYQVNYDPSVFHEEKIITFENDQKITFSRSGINVNPLLKDFQTSYKLKGLLDGTTEISMTVSYKTVGFTTKIYNQLFLRSKFGNKCKSNLIRLGELIEKV